MSLKLFSQEPAVPCYEQFIFLSYSWLLPLITVFPYETLSLSTEKIKDIGWDAVHDLINYSHRIGLHPHSSSSFPPNTIKLL